MQFTRLALQILFVIKAKTRFPRIDPLGQPKVKSGSDQCFRRCCPSVRTHFSNLEKQNNRKQCLLLARLWVWPSGSLMTAVWLNLFSLEKISDKKLLLGLLWMLRIEQSSKFLLSNFAKSFWGIQLFHVTLFDKKSWEFFLNLKFKENFFILLHRFYSISCSV